MRHATLLILGALCAIGSGAGAHAQTRPAILPPRVSLPLDGRPIDVSAWLGEDRRVELRGSVSSRLDGSEMDAFSLAEGSRRLAQGEPAVSLPEGAELLESDRHAHRYVVRLPPGPTQLRFAIERVAARQLLTRNDALAQLHGAIEVLVLEPRPSPAALPKQSEKRAARAARSPLLMALGAGLAVLLLAFAVKRRRARPEEALRRRAQRAARRVTLHAARLGPAFADVARASSELASLAGEAATHLRSLARQKRHALPAEIAALRAAQAHQRERLRELTLRLEATAAELASCAAGHEAVAGVDAALGALHHELELAKSADAEAHS